MKLSSSLMLVIAGILSLSFTNVDSKGFKSSPKHSLKFAIDVANESVGSDSIFVSSLNDEYLPDEFLISSHMVLVNDLSTTVDLLSENITFTIATYGSLELVDFDLRGMKAKIVNTGSMKLIDCTFQEGEYLGNYITNQGDFSLKNGLFLGSKEGTIVRDAEFSHSARLIL